MLWRFRQPFKVKSCTVSTDDISIDNFVNKRGDEGACLHEQDAQLSRQLHTVLVEHQLYLKANLKVADLARTLDVSEYRIGRAMKHGFKAKNFNQFVNHLRVEHAKVLLSDPNNLQWPVLVIGLESGFSSVGPFTRAFKSEVGCTPGQFRKTIHAEANRSASQTKVLS